MATEVGVWDAWATTLRSSPCASQGATLLITEPSRDARPAWRDILWTFLHACDDPLSDARRGPHHALCAAHPPCVMGSRNPPCLTCNPLPELADRDRLAGPSYCSRPSGAEPLLQAIRRRLVVHSAYHGSLCFRPFRVLRARPASWPAAFGGAPEDFAVCICP